jgi:hypothetical protein
MKLMTDSRQDTTAKGNWMIDYKIQRNLQEREKPPGVRGRVKECQDVCSKNTNL